MSNKSLSSEEQQPARRSRNGCSTCKERRVKCNERHPVCEHCDRLHLPCVWEEPPPNLSKRRRAFGPIKSRTAWTERDLLPSAVSPSNRMVVYQNEIFLGAPYSPQTVNCFQSNIEYSDCITGWHEMLQDPMLLFNQDPTVDHWSAPWDFFSSFNASSSNNEVANFDFFRDIQAPEESPCTISIPSPGTTIVGQTNNDHPLPGLLAHFTDLPRFMELSPPEHFALHYYQTTLSLSHTTKDPLWSTSMVFLQRGSNRPLVIHLLLASSLKSLVDNREVSNLSEILEIAKRHFRKGAELLIDELSNQVNPDHVSVLIAFWFLYLYRSRQANLDMHKMMQFSQSVADYVRKHKLDRLCAYPFTSCVADTNSGLSDRKRSLLARLLIWIFYADASFGFRFRGGRLAKYLSEDIERIDNIYKKSTVILQLHWGLGYPTHQVSDDIENSMVLRMLYKSFLVYHAINEFSDGNGRRTLEGESIEKKLIDIEEEYGPIFVLANSSTRERPRLLQNADWVASLFYALRIYYFRSTNPGKQAPRPANVEKALYSLITIIDRTYASGETEMYRCPQWPLLIAGAETSDQKHRMRIIEYMSPDIYRRALGRILAAQDENGGRISISQLREMCDVGAENEAQPGDVKRIGFGAWC